MPKETRQCTVGILSGVLWTDSGRAVAVGHPCSVVVLICEFRGKWIYIYIIIGLRVMGESIYICIIMWSKGRGFYIYMEMYLFSHLWSYEDGHVDILTRTVRIPAERRIWSGKIYFCCTYIVIIPHNRNQPLRSRTKIHSFANSPQPQRDSAASQSRGTASTTVYRA